MSRPLIAVILVVLGLALFALADHSIRSRSRRDTSWESSEDRNFINMPIHARYAALLWFVLLLFNPESWLSAHAVSGGWNVARALAAAGVVSLTLGFLIGLSGPHP